MSVTTEVSSEEHWERLIAAAKGGDKQAKIELWDLPRPAPVTDPATGLPYPPMPRAALSREFIYED